MSYETAAAIIKSSVILAKVDQKQSVGMVQAYHLLDFRISFYTAFRI